MRIDLLCVSVQPGCDFKTQRKNTSTGTTGVWLFGEFSTKHYTHQEVSLVYRFWRLGSQKSSEAGFLREIRLPRTPMTAGAIQVTLCVARPVCRATSGWQQRSRPVGAPLPRPPQDRIDCFLLSTHAASPARCPSLGAEWQTRRCDRRCDRLPAAPRAGSCTLRRVAARRRDPWPDLRLSAVGLVDRR
jgi:hypothetical protein